METHETDPKFAAILDALPLGVCLLRAVPNNDKVKDFQWRMMNSFAMSILSPDGAWMGKNILEISPYIRETELHKALHRAAATGESQHIEQVFPESLTKSGTDRWYSINIQSLGEDLLMSFENITEQKAVEAHIKQLAFQDELTGIYNRRYFLSRVPELIALAQREAWNCALIFFDLNGFKEINDNHGHAIGDKLLQNIAWRLSKVSREGDIFFRSGGDEFAFFIPNSSKPSALTTANRIRDELTKSFDIDGAAYLIGVSIGVTVMLSEDATVDKLLERADAAMYSAKERKAQDDYAIVYWTSELVEEREKKEEER